MDFLAKAIAEKKKAISHKRKLLETMGDKVTSKKFVQRGTLMAIEEKKKQDEARRKRQKQKEDEKEQLRRQGKLDAAAAAALEEKKEDTPKKSKESVLRSAVEVKRRLRALSQPITLFGETDAMRAERLKIMELAAHERQTGSMGVTNMFQDILAKEVADEIMKAQTEALEKDRGGDTIQEIEAAQKKQRKKLSKYEKDKDLKDCGGDREKYCLYWLKRMLRLWEHDLNQRDEADKRTTIGKHQTATQKQTRHNLKPLFKELKNKNISKDIIDALVGIVDECRDRNYIKANEHYLLLAIGNAAWPIGVTMVGIHERSGREKIFSQKQAHVLNDEKQRKYIQGVKRLMSYSSNKFPSDQLGRNFNSMLDDSPKKKRPAAQTGAK